MKKATIIDYGVSNILSVKNAFNSFGIETIITQSKKEVLDSDVLILPGVGSFEDGMRGLRDLQLIDLIKYKSNQGTPLLGICLGMQMLFDESEEFGVHQGLGLIPGRVEKIPPVDSCGNKQKVPHISWDPLFPAGNRKDFCDCILEVINPTEECYFIHSYQAKPYSEDNCIAETEYGGRRICAVVCKGNTIGMQFHPEKSGDVGLRILGQYIRTYF